VRVYTGAEADLLSEQAGRMAFTVGDALIFGHGSYRPATPEGQRLLADGLAAALAHGPGAHGPTPRALSVTDGGGVGGHGEGVGAVRPLAAASLFAGTGATGGRATAAQLLPLIRQVYARQRQTGAHPHALVGDVRAAERPEMVALHDSGAPAVVRVSAGESARRQTMDGWGTSLSWWAETMGQPGQQHYQQVLDMLFGDGGLRLNIARFNVGGGEHNAHDDPNEKGGHGDPHYQPRLHGNAHAHPGAEMPAFWREVPRGEHVNTHDLLYLGADKDGNHYMFDPQADYYQTKVLADANRLIQHQRGEDGALDVRPLYEAFANSAPDWMTRDDTVTGGPTGLDNLDPAHYKDYARYLMDFIVLARKEGFAFSSLEAFNEPDAPWWTINGSQEGMHVDPDARAAVLDDLHAPWWTINGSQEGMHVDPDARAAVLDDLHALAVEYNKGWPPAEQLTLSASDENNVYGTALDLDPSAQAHDWAHMPPQPNKLPSIGRLRGYETNAALRAAYERDDIGHLNTHAYAGNFSIYDAGAYGGNEGKAESVIRGWAGDPRHPRHKVWMSEVGVGDTDKYDPHNAPATAGVTQGRSNDRNNPQQAAGSVRATDGTNLAQKIIGDLKGLCPSAWIYWQAVEADIDTKDKKGGGHWNSWGLIRLDFKNVNNKNQGQTVNPDFYVAKQYYVMGNFSRFVRPGYTMIDIREPNSVAFVGGKELVIVTTAAVVDFDLSEFGLAKGTPVQGFVTSQGENLKAHSPAAIIGDKGRLSHHAPGVNATTTYVIPFGAKPANPGMGQGRGGMGAMRKGMSRGPITGDGERCRSHVALSSVVTRPLVVGGCPCRARRAGGETVHRRDHYSTGEELSPGDAGDACYLVATHGHAASGGC